MKIRSTDNNYHLFWCPGCNRAHSINNRWEYNGDSNNPTISPSILVKGNVDITDEEYAAVMSGKKIVPKPLICHSFVKEGKIQFLNDCTHSLAGQTVELPEWDKEELL